MFWVYEKEVLRNLWETLPKKKIIFFVKIISKFFPYAQA